MPVDIEMCYLIKRDFMSNEVLAVRISIEEVINSHAANSAFKTRVTPKKATLLSNNSGTLIQDENNVYYVVQVGEWFRSKFNNGRLPQVDDFNKLQDLGLTLIKDRIIRNEDKVVENISGQKIREQNNVSPPKINKAVGTDIKSKEKNKNRT